MWTGSVTGSHADNRHGVASQAGFARLTLQHRVPPVARDDLASHPAAPHDGVEWLGG